MLNFAQKRYDGFVLPLTVFLGLLIPFFVPFFISASIKPIGIITCVYIFFSSRQNIFKGLEQYLFFIFFSIYLCACCRFNGSVSVGAIGYLLYILYSAAYITINHSDKSIERIVKACFWSGSLFALFVTVSNPLFVFNVYTRTFFRVLWIQMNANQIAYFIVIGFAAFPIILRNNKDSKIKRLIYILLAIIMVYTIFLTLSRGGFICLMGISFLFILEVCSSKIKKNIASIIILLAYFIIISVVLYNIIPFDQMTRIFFLESYLDSNGRFDAFSNVFSSINNVFWGDGCDAWTGTQKIHNIFISIFCQTGMIGLFSFAFLVLYEIINIRHFDSLYFSIPFIVEAMVESGDSYTFWIPLIMISLFNKRKNNFILKKE